MEQNYVLSIGLLLLIMLYILTFFYMISKLRHLRSRERILFGALLAFIIVRILLLLLLTLYSLTILSMSDESLVYSFLINNLFVCDSIFVVAFIAFFRHYLAFNYYSHISLTYADTKEFFENKFWFIYPLLGKFSSNFALKNINEKVM